MKNMCQNTEVTLKQAHVKINRHRVQLLLLLPENSENERWWKTV